MGAYFVIKLLYRSNFGITDYLNNDYWVPIYFIIFYVGFMTAIISIKNARQDKKRTRKSVYNSLGVGVVLFLNCIFSWNFHEHVHHLPLIGGLLSGLQMWIENYFGRNAPLILTSWWGISLSWISLLIPLIGPYVGAVLALLPQNYLVLLLANLAVCIWD